MFKKVVIFGVGLIGGSFALALRRAGQAAHIVGVGRSVQSLERARELGIIDAFATDVAAAVAGADLILVAAPVAQTESILASIAPHLGEQAIVTDAGSTKSDVVAAARKALGARIAQFIPAHPIAGREKHGPEAALAELYEGKKVVITALPENTEADVETVAAAWRACGAVIHRLSAQQHDAVFASVSHLPHVLAFALVDDIAAKPHAETLFQYAASGFRDFTRIAASSPEMWRDITLANRAALLTEVDAYLVQLQGIREMIAAGDGAAIEQVYANAQHARLQWAAAIEAAERKAC
ncbi:prephenate dehydrogenase/arogenate dehydrogenase family protein [uncultured Herbaspirillum sp.]|uniref:prephenate dehydrogenase n=1 Tax=Herbaspirillum rubrisubalbicans TaxID=80842 RepID=UPI001D438327|nr:prephenate dehydrogenase/arogenate dehydrogenase family protein [uncultured Herbaspirillum sp.]NQE49418.1 prephenate dehydrogenase [Herbaspirillum rubrisubalbicans]